MLCAAAGLWTVQQAEAHGALVTPRPRQSIDYLAGVNTIVCANATGDACNDGQAAFYYSQGPFLPWVAFVVVVSLVFSSELHCSLLCLQYVCFFKVASLAARSATTCLVAARWTCATAERKRP